MMARHVKPLVINVIVMVVVLFLLWWTKPQTNLVQVPYSYETALDQRNEVSEMLNSVKQELAVMSCEMIELKRKLKKTVPRVSVTGGWCKTTSSNNSGSHKFDKPLAKELLSLFKSKRVASFGDGPGDYKRYFDSTQNLLIYDAYDGAPYGPETSAGAVKFLDLTAPQYGLPVYDWVISLEVAEHIPSKYESIYIDNIVRHAGLGIVMSWARPGQSGVSHVNNRPLSYVINVLSKKGFDVDMVQSDKLKKASSFSWFKKNLHVYYRRKDSTILAGNA